MGANLKALRRCCPADGPPFSTCTRFDSCSGNFHPQANGELRELVGKYRTEFRCRLYIGRSATNLDHTGASLAVSDEAPDVRRTAASDDVFLRAIGKSNATKNDLGRLREPA